VAVAKEKSWFVFDAAAVDRAWQEFSIDGLIERVKAGDLLDQKLGEEARLLAKGVTQVRWLGVSHLGNVRKRKDAAGVQAEQDKHLLQILTKLSQAGGAAKSAWRFYADRGYLDRWLGTLPTEVDLDFALLGHLTYTGVRFQEATLQGILYGACQERNLLQRNLLAGNVMEVPPMEIAGYDPVFQEAILSVSEKYLRERITRSDLQESALAVLLALQRSITFAREKGLPQYITNDQELIVAPSFSFPDRQKLHRKTPPAGAK
jgi:hypothetical protein